MTFEKQGPHNTEAALKLAIEAAWEEGIHKIVVASSTGATAKKLAELEQAGKLLAVVTQNIDGLHQLAGSRKVLELHGSVHRNYCTRCGKGYDARFILESEGIPRCSCGGIVKPDVVLYEESLDSATVQKAVEALERADLLIVGGDFPGGVSGGSASSILSGGAHCGDQ